MNRSIFRSALAGLLVAGLASAASAQVLDATVTLTDDRWQYPFNGSPGVAPSGGIFTFPSGGPSGTPFLFNRRDGMAVLKFDVELPVSLQGNPYSIRSAQLVIYSPQTANYDPALGQIQLFASRVSGTNGFTEATWTEASPFVGGQAATYSERDPYPIELGTGLDATEDLAATPWAVGVAQGYSAPNSATNAFPIVFDLDVLNNEIEQELRDDFASGISLWSISSTYAAAQPPAPSEFPRMIFEEGVSDTSLGTVQQAPRLIIQVETPASASGWELYQ